MPIAGPLNQGETRWFTFTGGDANYNAPLLTAAFSTFSPTFTGDFNFNASLLTATFVMYTPIVNTGNQGAGQFLPILGVGS